MKQLSFFAFTILFGMQVQAKVWRINNNAGVVANFTSFYDAVNATSVVAGDTLYFEPSATDYATNSMTLSKPLTVIGAGYFLDPTSTSLPANTGLQVAKTDARLGFFYLGSASSGSKFLGISLSNGVYINGASNIIFERVFLSGAFYFQNGTNTNCTVRKCFIYYTSINSSSTATISNFVCENSIFANGANIALTTLTGTGNIVRNNSAYGTNTWAVHNAYFVNNIIGAGGNSDLTDCTIKNNLFQYAQTLPVTATANLVSQDMSVVFVQGTTGSVDSRYVLKAGSPARGAGLTVGSVTSPDCGAYGATDPYVLSGIPNIPSIYGLTVPTSIPSGTGTMNITFSSKNN